jgi:integrase
VRKSLNAVRPFYRWCWREQVIDADHWLRIQDVSPPRGSTNRARPRPYKRSEVLRFWGQLDARWPVTDPKFFDRYLRGTSPYKRIWKHAMHLQTQAVVSLALFGGLRRAEIRHIDLDEIAPENEFVAVYGKSPFGVRQGFREVPYTEHGRRLVGEWLAFRENVLRPSHDRPWLVLTPSASPKSTMPSHPLNAISDDGFYKLMPAIGAWELHRFRHTCATEWLRAGVELEQVQRLLGHANIDQTLGYAELVRDDLARGVRRAEADFMTAVGRRNQQLAPPAA